MTIEEAERKLENMRFGSIVKSYCNKVNDIERLQSKLEQAEKEKQELVDMITEHYELSKKDMGEDYRVSMPKALYDYAKNSNK